MPTTNRQSLYDLCDAGDMVALEGTLVYASLTKKEPSTSHYDQRDVYDITIADPKLADPKNWDGLSKNGADTKLGKNILRDSSEVSHGTYVSKSGNYQGHRMWSFDSHSNFAPSVRDLKTGDSLPADQILKNELAGGQKILVFFSIYHNTKYNRNAGSLDGIGVPDITKVRYIGNGGATAFNSLFDKAPEGKLKPDPEAIANAAGANNDTQAPTEEAAPTEPQTQSTTAPNTQPTAPQPSKSQGVTKEQINKLFE